MRPWKPSRRTLALLAFCLPWAVAARAGTPLLIWPIDPVIAAGQQATALWLENQGGQPAVLQVRVFGWSQAQGEEDFQPQQAVLPSPPIATIAPGARQLVRLMSTRPMPAGSEQAFRVFIDELPTPEAARQDAAAGASIRLQMRYAVPLFVYGGGATLPLSRSREGAGGAEDKALKPVLDWQLLQDKGQPVLLLRNSGDAHARVTAVEWTGADGQAHSLNPGLLGYVLAGSRMRFVIEKALPRDARLRAQLNGRAADIPRAPD